MNSWPREIADDEAIVRGICYSHHVDKKGRLKPEAFRSPPEKDEVSVMRLSWIGPDICKQHSKELERPDQGKFYRGLAVLSAEQILKTGAWVVDSREEFEGHADLKHGVIEPPKGEPPDAEMLKILRPRWKALAQVAEYYPDPEPDNSTWVGQALHYKRA